MPTPTPTDSGTATVDDRSTRRGDETGRVAPFTDVEITEGDDE
jgi:hypothetical protein